MDKDNKWFKSIEGVLYDKAVTKMLLFPRNNPIKIYKEPDTIVGEFSGNMVARDYSLLNNLEEITFSRNSKNQTVGYMVSCKKLKKVTLPKNVITVFGGDIDDDGVFRDCQSLETVVFEKGSKTKYIPSRAFEACEKLKHIILPSSLTRISYDAFNGCKGLEKISFSKKLTQIGASSFNGCTSLKDVKFAKKSKLTTISDNAFEGCKSLKKVVFSKKTKDDRQ